MDGEILTIWDKEDLNQDRNAEIWSTLGYYMGYGSRNRIELVANSIFSSTPKRTESGGLEYSLPLWRPLLLNSDLLGKSDIPHGYYLGTITLLLDEPGVVVNFELVNGKATPVACYTNPHARAEGSLFLSNLRRIDIEPPKQRLTLWETIVEDFNNSEFGREFRKHFQT